MEGINLQEEEFYPGGPLFWRKKQKSQEGVPFVGGYPSYLFWNSLHFGKKSKNAILNLHM